jgi:hypothetical protein
VGVLWDLLVKAEVGAADLDAVSLGERYSSRDANAVDQRAVGGLDVGDDPDVVDRLESRVVARDMRVLNDEIAMGMSSQDIGLLFVKF